MERGAFHYNLFFFAPQVQRLAGPDGTAARGGARVKMLHGVEETLVAAPERQRSQAAEQRRAGGGAAGGRAEIRLGGRRNAVKGGGVVGRVGQVGRVGRVGLVRRVGLLADEIRAGDAAQGQKQQRRARDLVAEQTVDRGEVLAGVGVVGQVQRLVRSSLRCGKSGQPAARKRSSVSCGRSETSRRAASIGRCRSSANSFALAVPLTVLKLISLR